MMAAMSTSQPTAGGADPGHLVHVLRPRGSVVLGALGITVAVVLVAYSAGGGLGYLASMALLAGLSFVLLIRPHVRVSIEGVVVHNPFRRTFVPWRLLEDVGSRWNLELYAAQRTIRVWAIANPMIRPAVGASFGFSGLGAGRFAGSADKRPAAPPGPPTTAPAAAKLVESARCDWVDAVAEGLVAEPPNPRVTAQWDAWDIALAAGPALLVALAIVF